MGASLSFRRWRTPRNLKQVYEKWSKKGDFFTRAPVEWRWFYAWLSDPTIRPAGIGEERAKAILKDFGHPTPIVFGKFQEPPEDLRERLNALMGIRVVESSERLEGVAVGQRQEIEELKRRNQELQRQVDELLTANEQQMKELEALQRQTKCDDLRRLLDEQKASTPPPPPPPQPVPEPVTQQDEEAAVNENQEGASDLLRAIQGVTLRKKEEATPPPPPPPRDDEEKSTQKQLEEALKNRRGSAEPEDGPDDNEEYDSWADEPVDACIVCKAPPRGSCSQCFRRAYCGEECQRYDWMTYHGSRCSNGRRQANTERFK